MKSDFNKWCWGNRTATCTRIKLDYSLTPHTKVNSKSVNDLNVTPEALKFLEENLGSMLFDISLSNNFLDVSSGKGKKKQK